YHALVERCARDRRWDGRLTRQAALRCSDLPDTFRALSTLADIGMVGFEELGDIVQIAQIEDHVPPPHLRPETHLPRKAASQRAYRERRCAQGKHDTHCPKGCPARVTGNRDGNQGGNQILVERVTGNPEPSRTEPNPAVREAPTEEVVDPWSRQESA